MRGSWRAAEVWHWEKPGQAFGEGTASVAVKGPGLKGLHREDEPGEAIDESAAQLQQKTQQFGDASKDHESSGSGV